MIPTLTLTQRRKFMQAAVQPAVLGRLDPRRPRFHEILRVEVRARRVRRSRGVHNGKMLLPPQRFERSHRRMQSEETVKIEHGFPGNVDGRPHRIVRSLAVRHNNVQPVRRAALKDDDQSLVAQSRIGGAKRRASKKAGQAPSCRLRRVRHCEGKFGELLTSLTPSASSHESRATSNQNLSLHGADFACSKLADSRLATHLF